MNKKLFLFYILISSQLFGQSITIIPTSPATVNALSIKKVGIGLDHRSSDGSIGIGTYVGVTEAYIQTHTNHPLAFSTADQGVQAILKTNGYFGIGTDNPQYLFDVTGRARIRTSGTTAGIWFSKSNNAVEQGAFFGNLNDTQTGIFIGNSWRFSLSDAGVVTIPNLAGTGTRNVGADASGNLIALPGGSASTVGFSVALVGNTLTVPANATDILIEGTVEYNLGNAWNSPTFTAPSAGLYHFTVNLIWEGNATGFRLLTLTKNTINDIKGKLDSPDNSLAFKQHYETTILLNANDTIKLKARQNSGYNLKVSGEALEGSVFSAFKIN